MKTKSQIKFNLKLKSSNIFLKNCSDIYHSFNLSTTIQWTSNSFWKSIEVEESTKHTKNLLGFGSRCEPLLVNYSNGVQIKGSGVS
jgi:hypothetical protein